RSSRPADQEGAVGCAVRAFEAGKLTVMSRPPPGWARAVRVASWAVAMAWTMDRPRPRPSAFCAESVPSRWKGSKSRWIWPGATTGPGLGGGWEGGACPAAGGPLVVAAGGVVARGVAARVGDEPFREPGIAFGPGGAGHCRYPQPEALGLGLAGSNDLVGHGR